MLAECAGAQSDRERAIARREGINMHVIRAIAVVVGLLSLTTLPSASRAQVYVSITTAPPPLPVYVQPVIPGPDYMWVPGYWAWGSFGYYWVPGTWVLPPAVGLLWTPGYWGNSDGGYAWNAGYTVTMAVTGTAAHSITIVL